MQQDVKVGALYRHFKNHLVRVIGVAKHSETQEELVIYEKMEDVGDAKKGSLWARPKAMFLEDVTREGRTFPRFQYVDDGVVE